MVQEHPTDPEILAMIIGQTLTNGTNDPIFVIYEITPTGTCTFLMSRAPGGPYGSD